MRRLYGFAKSRIQVICHSSLPTPETTPSLCASIFGNGVQDGRFARNDKWFDKLTTLSKAEGLLVLFQSYQA